MSDVKHTPGPWIAYEVPLPDVKNHFGYAIRTTDGLTIAEIHVRSYCRVVVKRENAELIAKAPEMETSLRNLITAAEAAIPHFEATALYHEAHALLREAVAEARTLLDE